MSADLSVRSCEEIADAIRALTDVQWIRLKRASRYFAWVYDQSGEDLLQEAFCRALAGTRRCPTDVDVVRFLTEAMRSIANGEDEKIENQTDTVPTVQPGAPHLGAIDLKDTADGPEEIILAAETSEATRQGVLSLFPKDPEARDIADGILAGFQGEELQALTSLDKKGYASKRRFMRRTIDKHYPDGRTP